MIYDFIVKDAGNKNISLSDYKGKVLLIVNGATGCGFTPQYDGLQELYDKFQPEGFEILDFPSNQFLNQAPGTNDEISNFCKLNFGVAFKQFSKIDVNGEHEEPMYKFLKTQAEEYRNKETVDFYKKVEKFTPGLKQGDIRWNFTKFLIDRAGNVVARLAPNITPVEIEQYIIKLLKNEDVDIACHADFSDGCINLL